MGEKHVREIKAESFLPLFAPRGLAMTGDHDSF